MDRAIRDDFNEVYEVIRNGQMLLPEISRARLLKREHWVEIGGAVYPNDRKEADFANKASNPRILEERRAR